MNPVLEFQSPRYLLTVRVARGFDRHEALKGDLQELMDLIRFDREEDRASFLQRADLALASTDPLARAALP
jgi:hypothetical protein